MGYKCGNCSAEFGNKDGIARHMVFVHDSPFLEGDAQLVALSKAALRSGVQRAPMTESAIKALYGEPEAPAGGQ